MDHVATHPTATVDTPETHRLETLDITSPEARQHAFARYAELRDQCPVVHAFVAGAGDGDTDGLAQRPLWLFTDYEANNRGLLHPAVSVNPTVALTPEQLAELPQPPEVFKPLQRNLLSVDPPEHTRLRRLVQPAFTASAIEKLRPRIQAITDDLLDGIEARAAAAGEAAPSRQMELISQFAYPLPVTVICEMLGIPAEEREQTQRWSENLLKPLREEEAEEISRNLGEFIAYLRALFAQRRAEPQDDLITELLQAEIDGDRLTEDDVVAMVFILFVAGHITTVNLITNGIYALLTNPEQMTALRANPDLVVNAVEEILRYYGPAETSTPRFAAQAFEFEDQQIERGSPLLFLLASANHDPQRFADPETFDISRADANRHIAFGKGIHACLGAPLARLEGQIAIASLIKRYPDLHLAVPASEITWDRSFLRSLTSLPLTF
ncbi:MAG: cytochrome P450 [Thermomicrobiales bacterium]|nr:cytochrome P450 [Thermomicrobiales bacterium]